MLSGLMKANVFEARDFLDYLPIMQCFAYVNLLPLFDSHAELLVLIDDDSRYD